MKKVSRLTRYWITFAYPPVEAEGVVVGLWHQPIGFGVTAVDRDDALRLIKGEFFDRHGLDLPPLRDVVEDVDLSSLADVVASPEIADMVRSHMHPPNWRGVWYPRTGTLR